MQKKSVRNFHIGTQKAGSTYFYNLLKNHPDVSLSSLTEINYFSSCFDDGEDWYHRTFTGDKNRLDITPKYFMFGKTVAPRIKKYCDKHNIEAKFILILRNPIDYLFSHFQMHLRHNYFKKNPEQYPKTTDNLITHIENYPQYLERTYYYKILKNYWLPYFSLKQFKIVTFEDFVKNNEDVMNEILEFFELPVVKLKTETASKNKMLRFRFFIKLQGAIIRNEALKNKLKNSKVFNFVYDKFLTKKSGESLNLDEREKLKNIFKEDVLELKNLSGFNFNYWKDF